MAGGSATGGDDVFERFGQDLRTAVVLGSEEAKALGASRVRPEHLLAGLVLERDGRGARLLDEHGLDQSTLRRLLERRTGPDKDREALATVGIDVDQVRSSVEATFGSGALDRVRLHPRRHHLPFEPATKRVFHGTLRRHRAAGDRRARLDGVHLLLALLDADDPGVVDILDGAGVDPADLRRAAEAALGGAA